MAEPYPFPFPLFPGEITSRRSSILAELRAYDPGFAETPVRSIRTATLQAMRDRVDRLFLDGALMRFYPSLSVTVSNRMTSAAGKFISSARAVRGSDPKAEIRMSGDFLFRLPEGTYRLNGLTVSSPQEAFLVVFEHETVHAIEKALYGTTGHSKRFLRLAGGLFGHTGIHHELPTRAADAALSGCRPGARVSFPFRETRLTGVVSRIGKTVTVMVPDPRGGFRDAAGRRYAKYRVPLGCITLLQ